MSDDENPHRRMPVEVAGVPVGGAGMVVVMLHGRTQDPSYMRENVAQRLGRTDLAYLLPAAADQTWYPESFLEPVERNEPRLGWALERIDDVRRLLGRAGIDDRQIIWLGFSQGACLVSEYVARSSHRFGGLVSFTGGLIGPPEVELTRPTGVTGMPMLLTTSDIDEWVPLHRVEETATIFRAAGADVEMVVSRGTGHEIVDDSIDRCRTLIRRVERGIAGNA